MQPTREPLKVAIYIRVSTEEQTEKYGIQLQKEALLSLVKSRPENMVLAGEQYIYIDDGVSGTIPLDERPAFAQLREDIFLAGDEKPFDVVAVYKIDRFARKLKILLDVIDFFEENDIKFISANESIDTSTPFGKAMLGIIGVIAELERETIIKRTQDGREQAFEAGVALGAHVPYGFTKDEYKKYKVLHTEADMVRKVFDLFVNESRSSDYIAKTLTRDRIPSPQASAVINKKRKGEIRKRNEIYFWQPDAIRRILQDEIYIGRIYSNKFKGGKLLPRDQWKLSKAQAPNIIDVVTFEKAQRILSQSIHQRHVAKEGHIYLLSGLLKCDCCFDQEKDLLGRIRWSGERRELKKGSKQYTHYYKCARKNLSKTTKLCDSLPLPADEIEDYVINFSKKLLQNPLAVFNHQQKLKSRLNNLNHLRKKEEGLVDLFNALPARRERIREQHEIGLLKLPELKREYKKLEDIERSYNKELVEVRKQIAQTTLSREYLKSLELFSEKYGSTLEKTFGDRSALYTVLHELIEEIVVFSRDLEDGDPKVAGRRREQQKIPHKLHIKLKLPQEILSQLPNISSGYKISSGGR